MAAPAGAESFPEGYWERGWNSAASAVSYQVILRVDDIEKALSKTEKLLIDAGGTPGNGYPMNYSQNGAPHQRTLQYILKYEGSDVVAKKLFDVGDLQSFNTSRLIPLTTGKEIDERLALVTAELESNKNALKKMPVASHLLTTQETRLKAAKAAYQAGAAKATVIVTLIDATAPSSPIFR